MNKELDEVSCDIKEEKEEHRYAITFKDNHPYIPHITLYIYKNEISDNILEVMRKVKSLYERGKQKREQEVCALLADKIMYLHHQCNNEK